MLFFSPYRYRGQLYSIIYGQAIPSVIGQKSVALTTYIDDIVEGVIRVMQRAPKMRSGKDGLPIPPYAIYNIGGGQPENLLDFITVLQEELIRAGILPEDYDFEAHKELVPMQAGDVPITYADSTALEKDYGFRPRVGIREGLRAFAEWYRDFYL